VFWLQAAEAIKNMLSSSARVSLQEQHIRVMCAEAPDVCVVFAGTTL
jgi:hypothetical protein